jgi:hypothetical protein
MARPKVTDPRDYLFGVRLNSREKKCLDKLKEQMRLEPAEIVRVLLCNVRPKDARSFVGR